MEKSKAMAKERAREGQEVGGGLPPCLTLAAVGRQHKLNERGGKWRGVGKNGKEERGAACRVISGSNSNSSEAGMSGRAWLG